MKIKYKKLIHHKIGKCSSCGWTHEQIRRKRVLETLGDGTTREIIKPICVKCLQDDPYVLCDRCGLVRGNNLLPVSVIVKSFGTNDQFTCNMYLHLCEKCRKISHNKLIDEIVPDNLCETCKDKFVCYTDEHHKTLPGSIKEWRSEVYKRAKLPNFKKEIE